jgi:hypothetical protein
VPVFVAPALDVGLAEEMAEDGWDEWANRAKKDEVDADMEGA